MVRWESKIGEAEATPENGHATLTEDGVVFQNSTLKMTDLPNDSFNGLDGATIVAYVKPETALTTGNGKSNSYNSQRNTLFYVEETSQGNGSVYLGVYTDTVSCRIGKGTNDYGINPDANGSMRDPISDYTTTTVLWDSESYQIDVDGSTFAEKSDAEAVSANNKNVVYLGRGKADKNKNVSYWNGTVCELMFFDKKLSENELDAVYAYLAETYEQSPEGVPSDGLLFWMDASDGVSTDETGKVTSWASKVGDFVANAEDGAVTINDNASNQQKGLVFNGSSSMTMQTPNGTFNGLTGATIIAYAQANTKMAGKTSEQSVQRTQSQRYSLFYIGESGGYNGSVFLGVYTNNVTARLGTGNSKNMGFYETFRTATTDYTTTAVRWDAATCSYDVDVDGQDYGAISIENPGAATKNNDSLVLFGRGKTPSSGGKTYWDGTVCEILFYNRPLTDAELEAVYAYLNDKYISSDIPVDGVYLKEYGQQLALGIGETYELTATALPANATNAGLVWSSSNESVASVENGTVTVHGLGLATIYVETADGGYRAYCTVLVEESSTGLLWQDIQTIRAWADRQDSANYANWELMAAALEDTNSVTAQSTQDELHAAYGSLREAYRSLITKEAADKSAAAEVDALIEAIGEVTLDSETAILAALDAYDALTDEQKALVENADALEAARAALAELKKEETDKDDDLVITPVYRPTATSKPAEALPFTDVPESAWYYDEVKEAWQNGLINGMTADQYEPDGDLTVAQSIKLAAALHQMKKNGTVTLTNGEDVWYNTYVRYAIANDIIDEAYSGYTQSQMDAAITRKEFVRIFYGVSEYYAEKNTVADNAIPDVDMNDSDADAIYTFYRAGILIGNDESGMFAPNSDIKRSEWEAVTDILVSTVHFG